MNNILTGVKGTGLAMILAGAALEMTGQNYGAQLAGTGLLLGLGTSQIERLVREARRPAEIKARPAPTNTPKPAP